VMIVSNAFDPIELPANVSLLQERGLSRYRLLSNIIRPSHFQYLPHAFQNLIPCENRSAWSLRTCRDRRRHQ
jgi:hypothetical protein